MRQFNEIGGPPHGPPSIGSWRFSQELLGTPSTCPETEPSSSAHGHLIEWLANVSAKYEHARQRIQTKSPTQESRTDFLCIGEFDVEEAWDPSKHPRRGGPPNAGWFANSGSTVVGASRTRPSSGTAKADKDAEKSPPQRMLDLALAWWHVKNQLNQRRRDIAELTQKVSRLKSRLGSGGRYAGLVPQALAQAETDIESARRILPELEGTLVELERQYRTSGFNEIPVTAWTPGETFVGGKGIENVAQAVALGGQPAGLRPSGIEFDIALGISGIAGLGRAAIKRSLSIAAKSRLKSESIALRPYGGPGGGHHVPAKSALEGAVGYNPTTALAIPNDELTRLGVRHFTVTGAQSSLYREFARTGAQLTWNEVERIEVEALVRGGLSADSAKAVVKRAIQALKQSGVPGPTRVPWGGKS